MSQKLRRGGSATILRSGESSSGKKKVVTFKEDEIIPIAEHDSEGNTSPTSAKKNGKPKKGKYDFSEMDRGLERFSQKFGDKSLLPISEGDYDRGLERFHHKDSDPSSGRAFSHEPWEIDPTFLKINKVIGAGAFGKVYKGSYKGQQVAIKMLEWGDPGDEQKEIKLQHEFFQEVQIMHKIEQHPNICRLIGASLGSNNLQIPSPLGRHQVQVSKLMCCIVMEYIEGGNLREFWINHRKSGKRRMPFGVMVQFAIDIAEGLAVLHSKKICHRDLKPDNILMSNDCTVKIADFGLSRPWPEAGDDPMSLYRGTPAYSAPEVLAGKEYSHKCDVYSYGICIWELYTCDVPFTDTSRMDRSSVTQKIIHENIRPTIPCGCPAVLRRIMSRCWAADPAQRPEMAEVLRWLRATNTDAARCLTNDRAVECYACVVDTSCGAR